MLILLVVLLLSFVFTIANHIYTKLYLKCKPFRYEFASLTWKKSEAHAIYQMPYDFVCISKSIILTEIFHTIFNGNELDFANTLYYYINISAMSFNFLFCIFRALFISFICFLFHSSSSFVAFEFLMTV